MAKTTLCSMAIACMIGCTGSGDPAGHPLSGQHPDGEPTQPGEGCVEACSPYDPSQCELVCPPEPVDAAVPEDPYQGAPQGSPVDAGAPSTEPPPGAPVDASVPADPYARLDATHARGAGHRTC